jgi:hypothetical protein
MRMQWLRLFVRDVLSQKWTEMPDWLFRRFIQFQAIAADYGEDGLLPPVSDMAWSLRPVKETSLREALVALSKIGEAEETPKGWRLTSFKPAGDSAARVRKFRAKQKRGVTPDNGDVTDVTDVTPRNAAAAAETPSLLLSSAAASAYDSASQGEGANLGISPRRQRPSRGTGSRAGRRSLCSGLPR